MKIIMMLLSFLLVSGNVLADDKKEERKKGEWLKKELNLSDEQLEQVKEIKSANKSGSDEDYQKLKKAFKDGMKDPKATKEDLTSRFEAFQKARDERQRKRFNMMLKMREILTPEQLEKFHKIKKKHKGKFRKKK